MQPTFSSSRILLPAKTWFVHFSLVLGLLLNLIPTGPWSFLPDWLGLVLIFWGIREHRKVNMGWAFIYGLVMDVADSSLMGQHALAYVMAIYLASSYSRRILWFDLVRQALHAAPLLALMQVVQALTRFLSQGESVHWPVFIGPFLGALLWVPLTYLLLLPQYQPVSRDENKPI